MGIKDCIQLTCFDSAYFARNGYTNRPRPFLRPNQIKWQIKGRLRQSSMLSVNCGSVLSDDRVNYINAILGMLRDAVCTVEIC